MKRTSRVLASAALLLTAASASAQTTDAAATGKAVPATDPRIGRLDGGGDPNLLKNGTGNAQSPAVPSGGPTQAGSNPTSK